MSAKPTKLEKDLIHKKKAEKQEAWHNLVVKVILWKDGVTGRGAAHLMSKITPKEWKSYRKRITAANQSIGKGKLQSRLHEVWEKVTQNGGFA